MKCPFCASLETKVVDSRLNQTGDIIRRRRQCLKCEGRITTYERIEEVMPVVIKKDGRREPFNRDKIFGGIQKACQKRSITTEQVERLVSAIERKIQSFGIKEIPARTVGQMVMALLHGLDKVAYVRFASVYREFRDVEEFLAELKEIPEPKEDISSLSFPFVSTPEKSEKTSSASSVKKALEKADAP